MYSQNANVDYPCNTRSEGSLISCVHFYKSSKNFIVLVKKKMEKLRFRQEIMLVDKRLANLLALFLLIVGIVQFQIGCVRTEEV